MTKYEFLGELKLAEQNIEQTFFFLNAYSAVL